MDFAGYWLMRFWMAKFSLFTGKPGKKPDEYS